VIKMGFSQQRLQKRDLKVKLRTFKVEMNILKRQIAIYESSKFLVYKFSKLRISEE